MWPTASHSKPHAPLTAHVNTGTAPGTWLISSLVTNPILIHNGYFAEFAGVKASFTLNVLIFQLRCYWDNHISNSGVEMETGATRISLI